MTPAELEAIRADISHATTDLRRDDPSLLPELLDLVLTALGDLSTVSDGRAIDLECGNRFQPTTGAVWWASDLLRTCQTRAVSQIPFAEAPNDEAPHTLEHL